MKKSELKSAMYVKLRDGSIREYYKGYFLGIEYKEHLYIDFYNDDLIHCKKSSLDIMEVFDKYSNVIYERKEIDWSKVPVGTKVLVSDNENNWYEHLFINYRYDEEFKFKAVDIESRQIHTWKYCELAEEPKYEVTFYDVDKKMHTYCTKNNRSCDQACGPCVTKYILDNYNVTRKDVK